MKQLDILGIHVRDYYLREGIRIANDYLKSGTLNTIAYLSNQVLINAGKVPEQKEWIEQMDMTVFGNTDILKAAGIDNGSRIHEVENDEFFKKFMERVVREKKTVFLLADSETGMQNLQSKVLQDRENPVIAGSYLVGELEGEQDSMINEINDVAPGVVISCLPFEIQAKYMHEYRRMVNANVWLGLIESQITGGHANTFVESLKEKYLKRIFRKRVTKYNQANTEEQK